MIILDSCILRGVGVGTSTDLLSAIRHTGAHGVAVPWVVLEELVAQKAIRYQEKHERVREAVDVLMNVTPWPSHVRLPRLEPERVREHWREVYRQIVDVLPTSDSVLREATFREANLIPPCRLKKDVKTGGRDAAIWLSAIEYAKGNPEETVYFVSDNTDDFGDGTPGSYPSRLRNDVEELGDRFVHFTRLDDVFARFTERTDADEEKVRAALSSPSSIHEVHSEADDFAGWWATTKDGNLQPLSILMEPPVVSLRSFRDVEAYRMGESEWCTATASWLIQAITEPGYPVAFVWDTRVLISLTSDDPALSLLREIEVKPARGDDFAAVPQEHWQYTQSHWTLTIHDSVMRRLFNDHGDTSPTTKLTMKLGKPAEG